MFVAHFKFKINSRWKLQKSIVKIFLIPRNLLKTALHVENKIWVLSDEKYIETTEGLSFPKVANQVPCSTATHQMSHIRIKYTSRFQIGMKNLRCNIDETEANGRKHEFWRKFKYQLNKSRNYSLSLLLLLRKMSSNDWRWKSCISYSRSWPIVANSVIAEFIPTFLFHLVLLKGTASHV